MPENHLLTCKHAYKTIIPIRNYSYLRSVPPKKEKQNEMKSFLWLLGCLFVWWSLLT